MKKLLLFLTLILSFVLPSSALAADTDAGYTVYTKKGMVISNDVYIPDGYAYMLTEGRFTSSAGGSAVIDFEGAFIDTVSLTRIDIKDDFTLLEGVIGVSAINKDIRITTGTELAYIKAGSKVIIRVDDYGNAFNYCIDGSVKLVSKVNNKDITLNKGEYVAVTVKRQIRELRTFDADEINEMNVTFTNELPDAKMLDSANITVFEDDFADNGILGNIKTNTVCKIKSLSEYPSSRVFYLDCDIKSADIELYDSDMELIAEDSHSTGNFKPNVRAEGEADAEYYIYIRSASDTEYALYQERHISFYERVFGSFKQLFIPALIAAVCFIAWILLKDKFSKDTRRYFKK